MPVDKLKNQQIVARVIEDNAPVRWSDIKELLPEPKLSDATIMRCLQDLKTQGVISIVLDKDDKRAYIGKRDVAAWAISKSGDPEKLISETDKELDLLEALMLSKLFHAGMTEEDIIEFIEKNKELFTLGALYKKETEPLKVIDIVEFLLELARFMPRAEIEIKLKVDRVDREGLPELKRIMDNLKDFKKRLENNQPRKPTPSNDRRNP